MSDKPRMKTRQQFPPGGWQFWQEETKWAAPMPLIDSFSVTVGKIASMRRGNPRFGLATDESSVADELDHFNASRLLKSGNYDSIQTDEKKSSAPATRTVQPVGAVAALVAEVKRDAAGAASLAEWIGEGAHPVPEDQANERARVCIECPMNKGRVGRLKQIVADAITSYTSVKNKLKLHVLDEAGLKTCKACDCPLPLKVWVPLKHILAHTPVETFPGNCWIVSENAKPQEQEQASTVVIVAGKTHRPLITIQRKAAFGDVLTATALASKLHDHGYDIRMAVDKSVAPMLHFHPHIASIVPHGTVTPDIDLDGVYEQHEDRGTTPMIRLFAEAASKQLQKRNIGFGDYTNLNATLTVTDAEKEDVLKFLSGFKRPWVAIIPKSGHWKNRSVSEEIWKEAFHDFNGTPVWAGYDPVGAPILNMSTHDYRRVMAIIACCDLCVTVDTGPMHVAAALRKPILAIQQAFDLNLRLSDATDWSAFEPPLNCLRCGEYHCPIDKEKPPCTDISPMALRKAIDEKLSRISIFDPTSNQQHVTGNGLVSAIIPVLNAPEERIRRCVTAIQDQVAEILVSLDGDSQPPAMHPKMRSIPNPSGKRGGFGATCQKAARRARGEFLLFLNDDCYLEKDAVAKMLKVMQSNPKCAVVGCRLNYPDGTIQHGGGARSTGVGYGHIDHGKTVATITATKELEFVTFAAALVRRSAFFEVGGFDQRYDCYCEDSDLCLTLRSAGWKVMYEPSAVGIHDESKTTSPWKEQFHRRSSQMFAMKWGRYFNHNNGSLNLGIFA